MVAFWFLLICPGMAFVRLLGIRERLTELIVAIALSMALDTAVSETMVLTKRWSPEWGLVVLIGMSAAGAALQIIMLAARNGKRR
jgi:heme/copper-type cytochrome/quinol oxidase subunit 4